MIVLSSLDWRLQLASRLGEAAEKRVPLVYTRHGRPLAALLLTPPQKMAETRVQLQGLVHLCNLVFDHDLRLAATEIPARLGINELRRDVNETWLAFQHDPMPRILTRYYDVIGFVVPVPSGGTLAQVEELSRRFFNGSNEQ